MSHREIKLHPTHIHGSSCGNVAEDVNIRTYESRKPNLWNAKNGRYVMRNLAM